MSAYLTMLFGLVAMASGIWGIVATWPLFWTVIRVIVPMILVCGGLLAVLVGASEIRDRLTEPHPTQPRES